MWDDIGRGFVLFCGMSGDALMEECGNPIWAGITGEVCLAGLHPQPKDECFNPAGCKVLLSTMGHVQDTTPSKRSKCVSMC